MRLLRPALVALSLLPAAAGAQPASASVELLDDAIVFSGRIDARSAADFLRLLGQGRARRLVITSVGGVVGPALDMAEAIHAGGLDVEVPRACMSSCANYIFPAGRNKTAGRPGAVGWHGNMAHVLYLQQSGQANWSEAVIADARTLARREAEFFRRIGVDPFVCWFAKLRPYGVQEFYSLDAADMARFGIHGVTVRNAVPAPDVRIVAVDWPALEALRPAVRLEP